MVGRAFWVRVTHAQISCDGKEFGSFEELKEASLAGEEILKYLWLKENKEAEG